MALLTILEFPDERLRTQAKPVLEVDSRIQQLCDDMLETMYAAPGIGLAATQIDVHEQVIAIDVSENKNEPLVLINPEYELIEGEVEMEEGCLSVPGIYETIHRSEHIKVKALDRNGKAFEIEAKDLLAVCIQHEMDHLKGKLFVDYLSPLKRQRIRKKLEKYHKQNAPA